MAVAIARLTAALEPGETGFLTAISHGSAGPVTRARVCRRARGEVPDGLVLVPGVVGHTTNVVEHPDLVAQRINRFTKTVGADRVIASTDCGLGGRIHPDIA